MIHEAMTWVWIILAGLGIGALVSIIVICCVVGAIELYWDWKDDRCR